MERGPAIGTTSWEREVGDQGLHFQARLAGIISPFTQQPHGLPTFVLSLAEEHVCPVEERKAPFRRRTQIRKLRVVVLDIHCHHVPTSRRDPKRETKEQLEEVVRRPPSETGEHSTDQVRVDISFPPVLDAKCVSKFVRHVFEGRLPHPGVLLNERSQAFYACGTRKRIARRLLPNRIHRSCPSLPSALKCRRQVRQVSAPVRVPGRPVYAPGGARVIGDTRRSACSLGTRR
jgi:hypothetical protein